MVPTIIDPALLPVAGALTAGENDAAIAYAENEKAQATRDSYAADWRDFAIWCTARGASGQSCLPCGQCQRALTGGSPLRIGPQRPVRSGCQTRRDRCNDLLAGNFLWQSTGAE
jgi:hypothetical protein